MHMKRSLIPWKRKDGQALARREDNPILALHRQVDSLFDDFFRDFERAFRLPARGEGWGDGSVVAPSVDLAETDNEYVVTAEVPGLQEKDVEVILDNDVLTLRGEKRAEREEKKKNYHLTERSYGQFQRVIPLPHGVDREKAAASFKSGVLTITLPKTPEAKSNQRVIPVRGE
jgi:HSP20 family protein